MPLRKSVCFHTTLSSAKANVLNIHRVLLSISPLPTHVCVHTQTHTHRTTHTRIHTRLHIAIALGAAKHEFSIPTEHKVGISADFSRLRCKEKKKGTNKLKELSCAIFTLRVSAETPLLLPPVSTKQRRGTFKLLRCKPTVLVLDSRC